MSRVSAFEDKFMHFNKYYKKAFADPIKAKYGEVSFKTFVQHILSNKGCKMRIKCSLDTHWLPFYIDCGYCSLRYKYFVRAEHFDTDTKYIGLLSNIKFGDIEEHVETGNKIQNLTQKYFSQLDNGTIEKLYNLYKVDFEMFNYTPNF